MIDPLEVLEAKLKTTTQRELADQAGMDPTNLNHVRMRRRPAPEGLLDVLGLERVVIYRKRKARTA